MALDFTLTHEEPGLRSFEACDRAGVVVTLDVFPDYAQLQRGSGFVVKQPDEASARAYAESHL